MDHAVILAGGSPSHRLVAVLPAKEGDRFLAVWSRAPGMKAIPEDDLVKAGKRYLQPGEFADAEKALKVDFSEGVRSAANSRTAELASIHLLT